MTLESAEHWGEFDDPAMFGDSIERHIQNLPVEGAAARIPWVGSYWPKYLDGINYAWQGPGTESPARKYARAFGARNIEASVSNSFGIGSEARGAPCFSNALCGLNKLCAKREGHNFGHCMPMWYGMCHAWAPAAILFDEPRHGVWYKNVHFDVADIKALLTVIHDSTESRRISLRCDIPEGQIGYDGVGRPYDDACRDSNPGTYHLLLANYLGLRRQSFIEDRDMSKDVWNQPLRSFRVLQMQEVRKRTANAILGLGNADYVYNPQAERFMFVRTEVAFIRESNPDVSGYLGNKVNDFTYIDTYEYVLELTRDGEIIGGEWAGDSKRNHPDFIWLPLGADRDSVAGGTIRYDNVMKLVRMSYE